MRINFAHIFIVMRMAIGSPGFLIVLFVWIIIDGVQTSCLRWPMKIPHNAKVNSICNRGCTIVNSIIVDILHQKEKFGSVI